ncbi:MAG: GxxExxY protein [Gammaproteobacteria bacterium]
MDENEISREVVDAALKVHKALGPGLLESVYEAVLAHELGTRGLEVTRQAPIGIRYEGMAFEDAFRADLVVNSKVVVEVKSVERLAAVHGKQVLTYLRLGGFKLGLLVNFGTAYIKDGIERIINGHL